MRIFSPGPRLCAIAELASCASCVIDVGSDHARLPVWLLINGIVNKAYAVDISENSAEKARRAAEKYNLSDKLFVRCCDGLDGFCGDEGDTIVIAGVGGDTIRDIMSKCEWAHDGKHTFIIQCMSSLDVIEEFLRENDYICIDERLICENGRIYSIAKICASDVKNNAEFVLPSRFISNSELCIEYLKRLRKSVQNELLWIKTAENPDILRISLLESKVALYDEIEAEFKKRSV